MNRTDADAVVVVGAGPAGAVCARQLARAGIRVTLIGGASRNPADGETTSSWGADEPSDISSVLDPYGKSWLIIVPASIGRSSTRPSRLERCWCQAKRSQPDATSTARWLVAARIDGRDIDVRGDWVVDATGRAAWLVRQRGFRRRIERLTATGRRYDGGRADTRLLIESVSTGWWYSVPSFDGALIAVHVATHPLDDDDDWEAAISAAPLTAERVGRDTMVGPSWVRPAGSSLSYITGSNLLAVGDAMASFDPVAGDGLSFAVLSGIEAAATIEAAAGGDSTARDRYLRGAELLFARYRENRLQVYGDEHRWRDAPFWSTQRAS